MSVKSRIKFFMSPWGPIFHFRQYFGRNDARKINTS
jgi:hypothetical protein